MKKHEISRVIALLMFGFLAGAGSRAFGDQEIDLGDTNTSAPATTAVSKPAPTAAPNPAATVMSSPATTSTPASQEIEVDEDDTQTATQAAAQPTAVVLEVQGHEKMKYMYEAGIKYYKDQDYDTAIRYLTNAVRMKDPNTEKYYYAEAYAMLGVIYQYHVIRYGHAYRCYAEALKLERGNRTARRHIRQVYKYRHRKD